MGRADHMLLGGLGKGEAPTRQSCWGSSFLGPQVSSRVLLAPRKALELTSLPGRLLSDKKGSFTVFNLPLF